MSKANSTYGKSLGDGSVNGSVTALSATAGASGGSARHHRRLSRKTSLHTAGGGGDAAVDGGGAGGSAVDRSTTRDCDAPTTSQNTYRIEPEVQRLQYCAE